MDINAGDFRHRIDFLWLDDDENWQPLTTIWTAVNSLYGSEYWAAASEQAENTTVFTIRYNRTIATADPVCLRIVFDGQTYDVKHIDNVQYRNAYIKIKAVARYGR